MEQLLTKGQILDKILGDHSMSMLSVSDVYKVMEEYAAVRGAAALNKIEKAHKLYREIEGDNKTANYLLNIAREALSSYTGEQPKLPEYSEQYNTTKTNIIQVQNSIILRLKWMIEAADIEWTEADLQPLQKRERFLEELKSKLKDARNGIGLSGEQPAQQPADQTPEPSKDDLVQWATQEGIEYKKQSKGIPGINDTTAFVYADGYAKGYETARARLTGKQPASGWIPLEEYYLENGQDYLLLYDDGSVSRRDEEDQPFAVVTHYMHIPPPPKAGEQPLKSEG